MSNPCQRSEQLSAYLDGALPQSQSDDVKAHLETCPECRKALEAFRSTDRLIRNLPALEPSADFDRTFWRKVDAMGKEGQPTTWFRQMLSGWRPVWAGALAGLAVAVVTYFNTADPLTPEEVFIAEHMELLEEYDLIGQLEMLEHLDAFDAMKELT